MRFHKHLLTLVLLALLIQTGYLYAGYKQFRSSFIPENLDEAATIEFMLQNSNMGNEFYISFPLNDIKNGLSEQTAAIYICSYTDTKVRIQYPKYGIDKIKYVEAYKPLILSNTNGEASFIWEVTESEVTGQEGIHITSDDPVTVYVLNSKETSAEGYVAVPVSSWGNRYVHCSYYDYNFTYLKRGGGFIILAAYEGTKVTIKLNGRGEEIGKTVGNRHIGESFDVNLKPGQTYMICGDGSTDAGFDLSGTIIESTMPVGVISFHQRTMIPTITPNGKDHLSEMLTPVQSWGNDFVTMEFYRGGQGDFFRAVAIEDGTHLIADSYYPGSSNPIPNGHIETYLNKGQFWEYLQTQCSNNNTQNGVRGITVWHSNKPIQLMQYAYSFSWDGDVDWDPLMIIVPPVTQFQRSMVIQTPVDAGYNRNELTFFAYGNPNDPEKRMLNTVYIDGEKISKNYQQFHYNQIPGTNIFWGRINVNPGVHVITSKTKIYAYLNGFAASNAYGWPGSMGINKLDVADTLPPEFSIDKEECGNFTLTAFEKRSNQDPKYPQTDLGISKVMLIKEFSHNYTLLINKPEKFNPSLGIYEQKFYLNVKDHTKDAKAYFLLLDRAGNYIIDSLEYHAPNLSYSVNGINFINSRLNKEHIQKYILVNKGYVPYKFDNIKLKKGERFSIKSIFPSDTMPSSTHVSDTLKVEIVFNPIYEKPEEDSLMFESACMNFNIPLKGNGVIPHIDIADWNAGTLEIGDSVMIENSNGNGLRISNYGTDTLHIFDFNIVNKGMIGASQPFKITEPLSQILPIIVSPGNISYFKALSFSPIDTGTYESNLIARTDALDPDTISILKGKAYSKVGVQDQKAINDFSVQPNPCYDGNIIISYKLLYPQNITFDLFDNEGNFIKEMQQDITVDNSPVFTYSINDLPSGLYFISCTYGDNKIIKKLILKK